MVSRAAISTRDRLYTTVYFDGGFLVNSRLPGIVNAMAMQNSLAQPVRPRNARATRAAILDAARACFTQRAYEHVGVRDIAKRAGVNGALVIRYFGSKRQLFSAAMTGRFAFDHIVGGRPPDSERIVRMVLKSRRSGRVDAVLAVVRSAADPEAGAILKKNLEEEFIKPFAAALPGKESLQRAALITAYLLGLAIARDRAAHQCPGAQCRPPHGAGRPGNSIVYRRLRSSLAQQRYPGPEPQTWGPVLNEIMKV